MPIFEIKIIKTLRKLLNAAQMEKFFESRKTKFYQLAAAFQKSHSRVAWLRLTIFLAGISLSVYFIYLRELTPAFVLLVFTFIVFGFIVNYHRKIKESSFFNNVLGQINENEIKMLRLDIEDLHPGLEYLEESHPYAYDLDIFGRHSLFQLINRAVTPLGRAQLGNELKKHFDKKDILKRQQAIKELKKMVEWRQNFQANGARAKDIDQAAADRLHKWAKSPIVFFAHKRWKLFLYALWLLLFVALALIAAGEIGFYWIFLFNGMSALVLLPRMKHIEKFSRDMGKANILLSEYSKMLLNVEEAEFSDAYLSQLRQKLFSQQSGASAAITRLNKIIEFIENRANLFYIILNAFFMLDAYLIYKAEEWKSEHGEHLEDWLKVAAQFESLASFAGFAFANKNFCFPNISSKTHTTIVKDMVHPLIKPEKRVSNDFNLSGKGAVALITGSNMAGKSTFLRTIGLNLVLAQVGAPVCAAKFEFSLCQVFSSMRTKDNLEESVSTFYAELIRINQLIQKINSEKPLFYLLDEILKGTNSHDRYMGATALIKQLNAANTFGLVSSHDIELTQLWVEVDNLENFSFHSEIKENDIFFDYKLRQGPCKSFNAVALMKKMGISIH